MMENKEESPKQVNYFDDEIEVIEEIKKKIEIKIKEEEKNIKEMKRLPIGIVILIVTFISVSMAYAFSSLVLSYIIALLGYGLTFSAIIWMMMQKQKSTDKIKSLNDNLTILDDVLEKKKTKTKEDTKEEELVKEMELDYLHQEELDKPLVLSRKK